jgi:hypothetical protein
MPEKKFELGDYVEVKDRIKLFYELYAGGRLVTKSIKVLTAPDGTQRVLVKALAYRSVDDPLPGVGSSWLQIPGSTPYTRGSEVENAETSAWGRAIGALGILIDKSIASANEIENKAGGEPERPVARAGGFVGTKDHPVPEITADGGLIGTAITEGKYDFGLRQTPDGWRLPFRVKNGAKSFIVIAEDALAEALAPLQTEVIGKRITVWGSWKEETLPAKGTRPQVTYNVLVPSRLATADWILPAPAFDTPTSPDIDEDLAAAADLAFPEAETAPLGLVPEEAA